jgi:hypothetical protein
VKTPRIAECKVHFECELHSMMNFGQGNLVVGKVIRVHVRSDIIADFKIDPVAYSPLGRIGAAAIARLAKLSTCDTAFSDQRFASSCGRNHDSTLQNIWNAKGLNCCRDRVGFVPSVHSPLNPPTSDMH